MPVRKILKMGNPSLYRPSKPVEVEVDEELNQSIEDLFDTLITYDMEIDLGVRQLIEDMFDTLGAEGGGALAAPQIGVNQRTLVLDANQKTSSPKTGISGRIAVVNPQLEVLDDGLEYAWETCLCIPGLRGFVGRPRAIRYQGLDPDGRQIQGRLQGIHARALQHAIDHLEGILFPMRLGDSRFLVFESELQAFAAQQERMPDSGIRTD